MKKFKLIFLLLILLTSVFTVKATHYMGGEITWKCIPSGQPDAGKFIFYVKAYRECNGITFGTTVTLNSNSPAGNITLNIINGWPKDISPVCNSNSSFPHITCAGATTNNTGAIEEYYYKSSPIQLSGVPPASGWKFSWHDGNRNPSANIINASSLWWYLRAIMYPYHGTNTYPCFDNSPTFAEVPRTVICTGYPFTYNHNAYDKELDSLKFEWGEPMSDNGVGLPYVAGYSYTNPLPGPTQNPLNVAAVVNQFTGAISFTSYTTGAYVTSTKVTAYKCGIKIAEIWRDMQVVLLQCGTNSPPTVTLSLNNGVSLVDTVFAGELVNFTMQASDFQFLSNGSPQTLNIEASGSQFGSFVPPTPTSGPTFSDSLGCLNAPCATLTPAPGPGFPLSQITFISTDFQWQTTCDHLSTNIGCNTTSNVYNFILKVYDDFCPAPAINISTVTVVVLPKPTVKPPKIQCMKVLPNGNVEFDWSVPSDPMNTFDKYYIYSSTNPNGPFSIIDSISDINILTYTDLNANANVDSMFYYINTLSGCPNNQLIDMGDTFAVINLKVVNNGTGMASLTWNPMYSPILSTSTGIYNVYREYPLGVWNFAGSTTDTFFVEPISICGDDVSYRVEISDTALTDSSGVAHSCTSISNVSTDYFSDNIPPSMPIIDSVSVDPSTGFVQISWDTNAWNDVGGYIIYIEVNGALTPIDTLWGNNVISYIDQNNSPCSISGGFNTYAVAAFDTCGNPSAISTRNNTMGLTAAKDICEDKIVLRWNSYRNMPSGLAGYEVYASENGGVSQLIGTLTPNDTVFEHIGLNNGSNYCYFIRAKSLNGQSSSTSCTVCRIAKKPDQPQFIYIRSASVLPGNINGVGLLIYTDTAGKVSQYRIERSIDNINWNAIATLPPDYTNPTRSYIDASALVLQQPYLYRMVVVDSCGDDVLTSAKAKTMLLKVVAENDLTNQLSWGDYVGFDGLVSNYDIYRSIDGVWEPFPIINLPAAQTTYDDDVTSFNNTGGVFEYYINALEGPNNVYSFSDSARSNSISVAQKPKLYVPSAFNPESNIPKNRVFFPSGVFINSKDYLFIVFNRWGKEVFTSTEINKGWDGKYKNEDAPQGIYTYYVRFTTSSGVLFEDRGTVTLIR